MHNTVEGATINSTRDQTNCYEKYDLTRKTNDQDRGLKQKIPAHRICGF